MDNDMIEIISQQSANNAQNFIYYIRKLIVVFTGVITDGSLDHFNELWRIVQKTMQPLDIVEQMHPYFLIFKDQIEEENVEYMLNFDYSTLIVQDCEESTRNLIQDLVKNIKSVWMQDISGQNDDIRDCIVNLNQCSILHAECQQLFSEFN